MSASRNAPGGLTQKEEDFCLAYIANGGNGSEAYKTAYNAENTKPKTIAQYVCRLLKKRHIANRIATLRENAANGVVLTLAQHLEDLKTLRDEARARGMLSAAVNAEIARGKAAGLYVERQQVEASITAAEPVRVVFEYPDNGRLASESADKK